MLYTAATSYFPTFSLFAFAGRIILLDYFQLAAPVLQRNVCDVF